MKKNCLVILFISMVLLGFLFIQNNWIKISRFEIKSSKLPKNFNGCIIVQLSDLHSKSFGRKNVTLLNKIRKINPDIIVITGDMINSRNDDGKTFMSLAENLVKEYKLIYFVEGNHEQIADSIAEGDNSKWFDNYIKNLKKIGVIVLDNDKIDLRRGNESINIYGLIQPLCCYSAKNSAQYTGEKEYQVSNIKKSIGKAEKGKFNILLTHNPNYFKVYSSWGADLTLAGHNHGGLVRLPFIGGVFSPDKTLFPEYDSGEFESSDSKMIVSCGLGNGEIGIRLFNRPEITVITLRNS